MTFSEEETEDEDHPFALPQIVDIDNILNKSFAKSNINKVNT